MTDVPAGWRAIDQALSTLYGAQRPRHYAALVPLRAGGPDPLHGISAYFVRAPSPHWHFISYGLTELFEKESANPKVSGFGFELTFRLGAAREQEEPDGRVMGLMQSLARYVYATGRYFEAGHFFELPEPFLPGFPAVAFVSDPQLAVTRGAHGAFEFLQIVPLRAEEVDALKAWNTVGLLGAMAKRNPKWIFSPGRANALSDPEVAKAVTDGKVREGSATPRLRLAALGWQKPALGRRHEVKVGRDDARLLASVLKGRVPFGRPLEVLVSDGDVVVLRFLPAPATQVRVQGPTLEVALTSEAAVAVARALEVGEGSVTRAELPDVVFQLPRGGAA